MPEPTFDDKFATYADWSNNSSDAHAWRGGKLSAALENDGMDIVIYLVRETAKFNTFQITLGEREARELMEFLKFHFDEGPRSSADRASVS